MGGSGVGTGVAERLMDEPGKGLGVVGALAPWREGLGWVRLCRSASAEPSVVQHDKQPQESQDHQLNRLAKSSSSLAACGDA